jgi:hypothetical protein
VFVDLSLFEQFAKGFLEEAGQSFTETRTLAYLKSNPSLALAKSTLLSLIIKMGKFRE